MSVTKRQKTSHETDWAVVEYDAFQKSEVWCPPKWNGIPFAECSYEQIVHAGLSDIQPVRLNRNEMYATMTSFDGLLRYKDTDRYRPVQVKHHARPISDNDLGSFYKGCFIMSKNCPDKDRPILLTSSGVTRSVQELSGTDMFNFEIVQLNATQFVNAVQQPTVPMAVDPPVFELRECQWKCMEQIVSADPDSPFVVGLPPGTGKTVIALEWGEQFSTVLVAAPTRNLANELLERFQKHYGNRADYVLFDSDTFTDSMTLAHQKATTHKQIVVTTYASSHKVAAVFADTENMGVVIDEAHNMNSYTNDLFQLTGNPLLLSGTWEGINDDVLDAVPSDNRYILTMEEAEQQGYVLPIRWLIPSGIQDAITNPAESAQFLITVMMRKGLFSNAAFFGRVKEAQDFADAVPEAGQWHCKPATCKIITADTPQSERNTIKQWVQSGSASEIRVLASVKCCNEGVDLPALQSVYIPATGCNLTVIQRICRANRVDGVKKEAVVILNTGNADMTSISSLMVDRSINISAVTPVIENTDLHVEQTTAGRAVQSVRQGVINYREWRYEHQIEIYRQYQQKGVKIPQSTWHVEEDGSKWHIGHFVNNQRTAFKEGKLSSTREQQCRDVGIIDDDTGNGLSATDAVKQAFQEAFNEHGKYYIANIGRKSSLGRKCDKLRYKRNRGLMSAKDIDFYEGLGMVWDWKLYAWETHFSYWKSAKEQGTYKYGKTVYCKELQKPIDCSKWQNHQRTDRKDNQPRMTLEKIAKLDAAGFIW